MFEDNSGEVEIDFLVGQKWSLSPCNFEELLYVARIFLPRVIYEYIDIMFLKSIVPIKYFESDFLEM